MPTLKPQQTCSCPPEPPIDYGRAWRLLGDAWFCTRCGGAARDEQLAEITDGVQLALEQRDRMARGLPPA